MSDAVCIGPFPCPWPNRGQGRVGPSESGKAHWAKPAKLAKQQRARVAAAFGGTCSRCGQVWTAQEIQLGRGARKEWQEVPCACCPRRWRPHDRRPHQLPPHGPEHPVDVLFVRIPRAGAPLKGLDWDGAVAGVKALQDEAAEQLWPRDPVTKKLIGEPDDSDSRFRWSVRQRPHRHPRYLKPGKRFPPGWVPGPPDPPNKGTELVEIWIAEREDCQCFCGELRQAVRQWAQGGRTGRSNAEAMREERLLRAIKSLGDEPCGCGRSMLPIRWARGEL